MEMETRTEIPTIADLGHVDHIEVDMTPNTMKPVVPKITSAAAGIASLAAAEGAELQRAISAGVMTLRQATRGG